MREKIKNLGSVQVRHKPGCTVAVDGKRLQILDLESNGIVLSVALISFAVTAKLIYVFVFAYADFWFSHAAAQLYNDLERVKHHLAKTRIHLAKFHTSFGQIKNLHMAK